jgi:hypothetical protein
VTLSEFRRETADMPGDILLVQAWDAEGGYFSTLAAARIEKYVPTGFHGPEVCSPEDIEHEGIKNTVDALVLWPT